MRPLALATSAVVALTLGGLVPTSVRAASPAASLELVGRNTLANRGMNAALAIADHCAYVGSRNDAAPQVVDIADPANPQLADNLTSHPGSTPRELRTVPALRELAVLFYRLNGGLNGLDLYRWEANCATPALVGHYAFGSAAPHEFFLWEDPAQPGRVLVFVSMFATSSEELQVIDISNPVNPTRIGGWTVPSAYGHAPLHSIDVSVDGRTAYVSLWTGGLIVADSSDFATGRANPVLRPLTPPGSALRTPPGNVHSAVQLPGQPRVLTTDERYPSPFGLGCPFGTAHVVDVSNPAHPVAVSTLAVPENQPAACSAATRGTWTSHNPTLTAHLVLLTWYSAGLEVFALDDPTQPVRVAEYRAAGINPAQRDPQLGNTDTMSWSYPIVARGLVFLTDVNQGLIVLRYRGPHQEEISGLDFSEGNSNLTVSTSAPAPSSPAPSSPAPSSPAPSSPAPSNSVTAAASPVPEVRPPHRAASGFPGAALVAAPLFLAGVGVLLLRLRRRPSTPSNL